MADAHKNCPVCNQNDLVFKARQLYVESLARIKAWDTAETPELDRFLKESGNNNKTKAETRKIVIDLLKQFEPPSGKPQTLRSISPDMVMVVFAAVAIFFLYQIYVTQTSVFWFMLAIFVILYASYIIFHKKIIARYENQKSMDTGSAEVIQKAIGKWMKVSYCLRDNVVFGVNNEATVPLEQLTRMLIMASLPEKNSAN
ncbi:MAG: hypothetical protein ABFD24_10055 [Anaerolineaceae bacterium]|jgi:magnesium-transporting ATPase (P-type)